MTGTYSSIDTTPCRGCAIPSIAHVSILINSYIFLGFVYPVLLPAVAYLVFPWPCGSSGNEFVRAVVAATNGKLVVPVLWHCSTTSLNTANQRSFFPPPTPP